MKASAVRSVCASVGFSVLCLGIGLMSIPWALAVGGCVLLFVAVIGELRA